MEGRLKQVLGWVIEMIRGATYTVAEVNKSYPAISVHGVTITPLRCYNYTALGEGCRVARSSGGRGLHRAAQQNVFGTDVSMYNLAVVHSTHGGEQLVREF